jgi:hypothetical protein
MRRAYSLMTLKEFDDEKRTFSGIATTTSVDRMGDIVESKGAEFQLPIPLLSHHNPQKPIGHVTAAKVLKDEIQISGHVLRLDDAPPALKERLDVAWAEIKSGLVRGLSIGFQPLESARIEGSWGYRFTKWLWLELSAVTIPANGDSMVTSIKSIEQRYAATFGQRRGAPVRLITPPGVSGSKPAAKGGIPLITRGETK